MKTKKLLGNVRFYVLGFTGVLIIAYYLYITATINSSQLQIIRLTQYYSLTSVTYLYIALLVGPLSRFFNNRFIQTWLKARRAIGVSAYVFGLIHALVAFFGQLGGFAGLPFLGDKYLLAISLSFTALLILSVMAATSFDFMVAKLGFKNWKRIHKFVYLASFLILTHALLLGTHFHDLSETIPVLLFFAGTFLICLHVLCWEKRLRGKILLPKMGVISLIAFVLINGIYFWFLMPFSGNSGGSPISVHGGNHGGGTTKVGSTKMYMPGMEGDRSKKYNVQFLHQEGIQADVETELRFRITDQKNGEPVYYFQTPFEKPFHLIIVDESLNYFSHIHPAQEKNDFVIKTNLANGKYHLYIDFQPFGAIEQQLGFQLVVGNGNSRSQEEVKFENEKQLEKYNVKFNYPKVLRSKELTQGLQQFKFTIFDKNEKPVTDLYPYLAAFGHLVMIKKDSFEYIHVHPIISKRVEPNERSGPDVTFAPMPIYGTVTPGVYKVFGQFNPGGELIVADFWIRVE